MLDGPNKVGRVIARPFTGPPGNFRRTERRHDYAVEPPRPMLMDVLVERKIPIFGIGKIHRHLQRPRRQPSPRRGRRGRHPETPPPLAAQERPHLRRSRRLRHALRTPQGRGGICESLEEFDTLLAPLLTALRLQLLMITADHSSSRYHVADDRSLARVLPHHDVRPPWGSTASTSASGTLFRHGAKGHRQFRRRNPSRKELFG